MKKYTIRSYNRAAATVYLFIARDPPTFRVAFDGPPYAILYRKELIPDRQQGKEKMGKFWVIDRPTDNTGVVTCDMGIISLLEPLEQLKLAGNPTP